MRISYLTFDFNDISPFPIELTLDKDVVENLFNDGSTNPEDLAEFKCKDEWKIKTKIDEVPHKITANVIVKNHPLNLEVDLTNFWNKALPQILFDYIANGTLAEMFDFKENEDDISDIGIGELSEEEILKGFDLKDGYLLSSPVQLDDPIRLQVMGKFYEYDNEKNFDKYLDKIKESWKLN